MFLSLFSAPWNYKTNSVLLPLHYNKESPRNHFVMNFMLKGTTATRKKTSLDKTALMEFLRMNGKPGSKHLDVINMWQISGATERKLSADTLGWLTGTLALRCVGFSPGNLVRASSNGHWNCEHRLIIWQLLSLKIWFDWSDRDSEVKHFIEYPKMKSQNQVQFLFTASDITLNTWIVFPNWQYSLTYCILSRAHVSADCTISF